MDGWAQGGGEKVYEDMKRPECTTGERQYIEMTSSDYDQADLSNTLTSHTKRMVSTQDKQAGKIPEETHISSPHTHAPLLDSLGFEIESGTQRTARVRT